MKFWKRKEPEPKPLKMCAVQTIIITNGIEGKPLYQSLVINLDDLQPLHKEQLLMGNTIILGYVDDHDYGVIQKYKLEN